MKKIALGISIALLSTVALAEQHSHLGEQAAIHSHQDMQSDGDFYGNAQLGGTLNTGNTQSQSINARLINSYLYKKWRFYNKNTFQYGHSKKDGVTAQVLDIFGQARYFFQSRNFVYANADYTNDRFDGFIYKLQTSAGIGRRIYQNAKKTMSLDLQAGPGFRIQPPEKNVGGSESDIQKTQFTFNTLVNFHWQITEKTSIGQSLSYSYAKDNSIGNAETDLTTDLVGKLGLQLTFDATHNSRVPEGTKKLDTVTTVSLVYAFGRKPSQSTVRA